MTYIVGNYKVTKYNSTNQLIFNILYHIYKNSKQLLTNDKKEIAVDSRTKCNREEELGEKFERGDVVMFLPGSVVE